MKGINLEINDGEFLIMVGPSGCGKTTTLNMISGLVMPSSGEISIGENDVTHTEPGERGLGMVFQDLALFPHMSVFENIAFGLRVKNTSEQEVKDRVQQAAEAMHIEQLLSKRPGQCSGGEAQRVALARTIVTNPSVYLMDEPLSSLDAKLRIDMRTELKGLHERLSGTFVYVTHDQAEAMTMADRIVVMNGGEIEQLGGPLDIYRKPATRFVAGFFGMPTMNFLDGEIAAVDGAPMFVTDGIKAPLEGDLPANLSGRKATLGVRSEHVLATEAENGGKVSLIEPLGDATLVYFDYGGPTRLVSKVDPDRLFAPGDDLTFAFDANNCHLFDADNGARLN
ncbi:MAG: ABC transporter ATP-binding protein [Alphaproteobacteria bacterium]|nr:ABC transporter ATP-binding protein [Alphaproteobacteria bacterium]